MVKTTRSLSAQTNCSPFLYVLTKMEPTTNHWLRKKERQTEVWCVICDLSVPQVTALNSLTKVFSPQLNQPHQFGGPLQSLFSRIVSYKPRVCWSAWGLGSFMSLSELNTPQLIFLKVSCFCKLCQEKYIDWVWQLWGNVGANKGPNEKSLPS